MAAVEKTSGADLQALDKDHHLHPFTDHKALHEKKSRIITRAEGVYIFDADGNRILDGMSGLWCVNAGYGRNELIDAAVAQMKELPAKDENGVVSVSVPDQPRKLRFVQLEGRWYLFD